MLSGIDAVDPRTENGDRPTSGIQRGSVGCGVYSPSQTRDNGYLSFDRRLRKGSRSGQCFATRRSAAYYRRWLARRGLRSRLP